MKRILITGANGMLGTDLCQELRKDYEITGIDISSLRGVHPFFGLTTKQSINCDITNKGKVMSVVNKIDPDVVIHAAAMTDVDGCELSPKRAYKINSDGTRNVALACKAAGATLIYISTDFVFDGKKKRPYKETDKTNPLGVYADSKLKGEEAIRKTLKRYYILRTSWLYGRCGKNFVDTIVAKAKRVKVLSVVYDQVGSPTYTKDLAKAIHNLILRHCESRRCGTKQSKKAQYGTYHISNSGSVSWFDYAKEILKLAGVKTKVIPITSTELNRPAKRPAMSVLDNSKFIKSTGYRMRNWREALSNYVR